MEAASRIRRARFVKNFGVGVLITGVVLAVPIGLLAATFWGSPQCTTLFLHYNYQYRAGNPTTENTIINESIRAMVDVMDRHPTWHYTIEFQALVLERLIEEPSYRDILDKIQRQMGREQLELICGVYSSQIINAYPIYPLSLSMNLTADLIAQANSLYTNGNITQSRAFTFQEGQYSPGLPFALEQANTRIDTIIISSQQLGDFRPSSAGPWDQPLQRLKIEGKQMNLIIYDYLPRVEAGYLHGWVNTQDAELIFESQEDGAHEFQVDPARVASWEGQWAALERRGVTMMTCEEWTDHCENVGAVQDLTYYFLPTHWGPTKYNTAFTWFGDNAGNTDDGALLATNFRTQLILRATKWLNDTFGSLIISNQTATARIRWYFANATRCMLKAMVTDTTGINPSTQEREYGYANTFACISNCSAIIQNLQWALLDIGAHPTFTSADIIQVDLLNGKNYTTPVEFNGTTVTGSFNPASINQSIPLEVSARATGTNNLTQISGRLLSWGEFTNIMNLQVTFPGTNQWGSDGVGCDVRFAGQLNTITVSVPIVDNLTRVVTRSNYVTPDILKLHLPLSLGYIYVPGMTIDKGTAIIWNASAYQIAPLWTEDAISFQTSPIHINATFDFYILNETSAATGLTLAQRLNHAPPVTLSANATHMFGYEFYAAYQNVAGGESEINEWWK